MRTAEEILNDVEQAIVETTFRLTALEAERSRLRGRLDAPDLFTVKDLRAFQSRLERMVPTAIELETEIATLTRIKDFILGG